MVGALEHLTETQQRILDALCRPQRERGAAAHPATNREIAEEVFLSVDAVKGHLRALYAKAGIEDLPQNEKRARLADMAASGELAVTLPPASTPTPIQAGSPPRRSERVEAIERPRRPRPAAPRVMSLSALGAVALLLVGVLSLAGAISGGDGEEATDPPVGAVPPSGPGSDPRQAPGSRDRTRRGRLDPFSGDIVGGWQDGGWVDGGGAPAEDSVVVAPASGVSVPAPVKEPSANAGTQDRRAGEKRRPADSGSRGQGHAAQAPSPRCTSERQVVTRPVATWERRVRRHPHVRYRTRVRLHPHVSYRTETVMHRHVRWVRRSGRMVKRVRLHPHYVRRRVVKMHRHWRRVRTVNIHRHVSRVRVVRERRRVIVRRVCS